MNTTVTDIKTRRVWEGWSDQLRLLRVWVNPAIIRQDKLLPDGTAIQGYDPWDRIGQVLDRVPTLAEDWDDRPNGLSALMLCKDAEWAAEELARVLREDGEDVYQSVSIETVPLKWRSGMHAYGDGVIGTVTVAIDDEQVLVVEGSQRLGNGAWWQCYG